MTVKQPGVPLATQSMRALTQELGMPDAGPYVVDRDGRTFLAKQVPGGRYTPATLWLTVKVDEAEDAGTGAYRGSGRELVDPRPALVLRRESALDRAGKWLRLDRSLRTGDAAFDAAVLIETDASDEDVRRTLADEAPRRAVRALLSSGVSRVVLDPEGLSAVRDDRNREALPSGGYERTAKLLADAASGLPLFARGRAAGAARPVSQEALPVALLFVVAMVLPRFVAEPADPVAPGQGAVLGLCVWLVVVAAAVTHLRGRSRALVRLGTIAFLGLFTIPASAYWVLCWANRALDTGPPTEHATHVTGTGGVARAGDGKFAVAVAPWRPGMRVVLQIPTKLVTKATEGAPLVVITRPGLIGWEWVEGWRLGE